MPELEYNRKTFKRTEKALPASNRKLAGPLRLSQKHDGKHDGRKTSAVGILDNRKTICYSIIRKPLGLKDVTGDVRFREAADGESGCETPVKYLHERNPQRNPVIPSRRLQAAPVIAQGRVGAP